MDYCHQHFYQFLITKEISRENIWYISCSSNYATTSCNYHIQRILNNGYIFSYGQLRSFRTILYHQLFTEWIKKEISRENIYWYTYSSSHNLIPYHMVYAYIGLNIIKMHITSYIMDNRIAINMS